MMSQGPERQPERAPRLDLPEQTVPGPEPDRPGPLVKAIVGIVAAAIVVVVLHAVHRSEPGATTAASTPSQAQTTGAVSPGPANN